jgi:acyl-CoA synthetase (AMP-forming)/AMP-acid ligase II
LRTSPEKLARLYRERGAWGDTTIADLFRAAVAAEPDREALVDALNRAELDLGSPQRMTFAELAARVDKLELELLELGFEPGDKLLAQLPNIWEVVALYLACAELGLVLSPVAVQYRRHEFEYIVRLLEPVAFVTCRRFKGFDHAQQALELAGAGGFEAVVVGADVPAGVRGLSFGAATAQESGRAAAYRAAHRPSADDIFTICWTSGTEGVPKGVPRSHNHWLAICIGHFEAALIAPGDRLLNPFPMINMAAIGGCFLSWLLARGTLLLHHPLDLKVYLRQIAVERPHYAIAPPAVLNMLIRDEQMLASVDLGSLRCIGSGSAPLAPDMIAGFRDRLGIEIVNIFGSNEGVSLMSGPGDIADPAKRAKYFPRFGRPDIEWPHKVAKHIETRIVDLETGREITEPGRPGELQIRGPTVFDGYFRAPEMTARAFTDDGYFRTGDMFEIVADEQGPRLYQFAGRCRLLIVRGGVKISPEEIDDVLAAVPEILEGATAGYPDEVMGERICAVVVPRPGKSITLEQLQKHFEARGVAVFKWPERLLVTTQLPRNPLGKVMRAELVRMASARET